MMHVWSFGMSMQGLCTFETVILANLLERMTNSANLIHKNSDDAEVYSLDKLIFDYKQITIVTDQLNDWVAYKILAFHMSVYVQFISDVFVAIQILKNGGGFGDIG